MFDLDTIENDWKDNSFALSEEEIIEIYKSEGATLTQYYEAIDEYHKKIHVDISAEERLLAILCNDPEANKKIEYKNKLISEIKYPSKKHLSKESQKKVVEGCLYMVFDSTRDWYNFFNKKISLEKIYYVCLEALMTAVKYAVHCEKSVFRLYVDRSIERNIIKYVSRWEKITYREAYRLIKGTGYDDYDFLDGKKVELSFDYNKETPERPTKIYNRLRNEYYDVNYIKNISSVEFMKTYNEALDNLDEVSRMVMQFSFDIEGNKGFSCQEIAEYLGFNSKKVSNIRRKAIKTLRKDKNILSYK